jgi:hypothetical protein
MIVRTKREGMDINKKCLSCLSAPVNHLRSPFVPSPGLDLAFLLLQLVGEPGNPGTQRSLSVLQSVLQLFPSCASGPSEREQRAQRLKKASTVLETWMSSVETFNRDRFDR